MSWLRRNRGEVTGGPVDVLQRDSTALRRWVVVGVCVGVVLLAGISIVLAWQQYDDAKEQAKSDLQTRVAAAAALVDTSFSGEIETLSSIARAPSVVGQQLQQMRPYFLRVNRPGSEPFTGGIGWIDRAGILRATNLGSSALGGNVGSRDYFRRIVATHRPYISAGLIGKAVKQPVVVVAVPTFGPGGELTGVLAGSTLLRTIGQNGPALQLAYGNLLLVDRNGQLLLGGLERVSNTALFGRIQRLGTGVVSGRGLDGQGDDVVAFATAKVPGWVTAIDRPRSSVFSSARRALFLELGSVLAAALLVLTILFVATRRAGRKADLYNQRARAWSSLSRALTSANTPAQVVDALLVSLSGSFPNAVAVVGIESQGRLQPKAASRLVRARRITESARIVELVAEAGKQGPRTVSLEHEPELRDLYTKTGRGMRAVHGLPITGSTGESVGTITLLSTAAYLESHDWAVLRSFADQASRALERAWRFVQEHELAVRLQRSLLPERLPSDDGLELAGHYLAGAEAVEVGGDWYDAVRRPDGTVHLCVGDVSGKGIGAATVMSRQRHTFEVYAHDLASPAEIIRRMLRHADGEEMITIAIVTLDPYLGELRYSCVGHPPPLLLDADTGERTRLDGASAPPVGVAVPVDIVEAALRLPDHAALLMYTDGLIERRGRNIEDAIVLLSEVLGSEPVLIPDAILARIENEIGSPDDDVALLLLSADLSRVEFDIELPADAAALGDMRLRLGAWLARRGLDSEQAHDVVLAVSEACNNAIEHAYGGNGGGPVKVSLKSADGEMLRIVVEDHGAWRDPVPSEERGRGIGLMEHLMHSIDIQTGLHGTRVTLEWRASAGLSPEPGYVPARS